MTTGWVWFLIRRIWSQDLVSNPRTSQKLRKRGTGSHPAGGNRVRMNSLALSGGSGIVCGPRRT